MTYAIVLGVHVIVCTLLILVVLLQSAKGGGLAGGSAFGGGADMTMFGARGTATVLSKATTIFGAAFMITSLSLTFLAMRRAQEPRSGVIQEAAAQAPIGVPAAETAPPPAPVPGAGAGAPAQVPVPADEGAPSLPEAGPAPAPPETGPAPGGGP